MHPQRLATATQAKVTAEKSSIGRQRLHFFGFQPPKKFLGSLQPDAGTLALLRQPSSTTALLLPTNCPCCGEVSFTMLLHPGYLIADFTQERRVKAIKSFDYLDRAPRICTRSRTCLRWERPRQLTHRASQACWVAPASECRKSQRMFWPRKSSVRQLVYGAAHGSSDKIACRKETITCHF